MLTCVVVSDFHMRDVATPPGDLLIVGGDMTFQGEDYEMSWFEDWLVRQPQETKIWIAGNHEMGLERNQSIAKKIAERTGSVYLNDELVVIKGLRIWGSPITPTFGQWAFMRERGEEIRSVWDKIPERLDILITHGPPHGFLDVALSGQHAGCEELRDVLMHKLEHPPKYHVFGHFHGCYGRARMKTAAGKTIELLNASACNEQYRAVNPVMTFDLEPQNMNATV